MVFRETHETNHQTKPNHLHSLFFNFTAGELSLINFLDCATENANASV